MNDFDEPVSEYIKSREQRNLDQQRSPNPFKLPSRIEAFGFKEQNKKQLHEEREKMRKMTLLQRTDSLKPSIPPCIIQKSRSNSVMSRNRDYTSTSNTSSTPQMFEKHTRTTEFIQQKREIYIMQMVIDKKSDEIKKIENEIKKSEIELVRREQKIEQELQDVKLQTTKCEIRLARARKKAEDATRHRVELIKKVKQVSNSVAIMNSEIFKNEDLLESYHRYDNFLRGLTPDDKNIFEYFTNPSVLIEDMTDIENKNLAMIKACHYYSNLLKKGKKVIQSELDSTENTIEKLNDDIEICHKDEIVDDTFDSKSEQNKKRLETVEEELERLILHIRKTYMNCLKKEFNHNPISMLEEVECTLHDLQIKLNLVDPSFINEKQIIKDKERREEQRREKQILQEIEQAKKMRQALERATKPIKKKTGRPIIERSKLVKLEKKDDQLLIRQRQEQQRLEKLLYGSPYE